MIWNKDLLFLHPQKTAGMALSTVLLNELEVPIFNSVPLTHLPADHLPGVAYVPGLRHENMFEALEILKGFNLDFDSFKYVVVTTRNPYDMEISRYYHLRKPEAFEKNTERDLATNNSFDDFCLKTEYRVDRPHNPKLTQKEAIKSYYSMGSVIPDNLRLIRYESLNDDLNLLLTEFGYPKVELPQVNISTERKERDYTNVITRPEIEESIYRRYKWIFTHGFYERLNLC